MMLYSNHLPAMNNQTKDYADFIRKFNLATFPFKAIFEQNQSFKNSLLSEFPKTRLYADPYLYTAQYLTDEEINIGLAAGLGINSVKGKDVVCAGFIPYSNMETRLHGIRAEFEGKIKAGTLGEQFYSFDFDTIETIKTLNEIKQKIENLQHEVFKNEGTAGYDKRAEVVAESVNKLLSGLENKDLATAVFHAVMADKSNVNLDVERLMSRMSFLPNSDIAKYSDPSFDRDDEMLRMHFEHYLSKGFTAPPLSVVLTPPASDERKNGFSPDMPLDEVRRWFLQLAETNSKNGSPFLTVEQVGQFIDRAFCGESFAEMLSINERKGDKANVVGLFHKYYTYCIKHQSRRGKIDPSATAEKYVKLLTDNFDNWDFKQVKDNFRSGGVWKDKP